MYGALEPLAPERNRLTFTRVLAHPREKVWRAVTENQHLAAWFPDGEIRGERAVGARLEFSANAGGMPGFEGEMLAFEPPSLIEFLWGTDTIRIELEADGDRTILTFTDTFAELGKAARDGAGWHDCLDELVHHLDGTTATVATQPRWVALHATYIDRLGPEASTIGVPEEYESVDD